MASAFIPTHCISVVPVFRLGLCVELVTQQFRPTETLKLLERLDDVLELVAEFERHGFVVARGKRGIARTRSTRVLLRKGSGF